MNPASDLKIGSILFKAAKEGEFDPVFFQKIRIRTKRKRRQLLAATGEGGHLSRDRSRISFGCICPVMPRAEALRSRPVDDSDGPAAGTAVKEGISCAKGRPVADLATCAEIVILWYSHCFYTLTCYRSL